MAYQIAPFSVTIPAGTSIANPVHIDTPVGHYLVVGIEMTIPPGLNGRVGFRFTSGGLPVIPSDPNAWFVISGQPLNWPITDQLSSGAWQITGYNLGINDHTLYVRYLLDLPSSQTNVVSVPLLDPAAIMGVTGTMIAGSPPQVSA